MNDPIKIIYKYKNDNRKNQYQYYIFVGSLLSTNLLKILKKIQDLNFFDTLVNITENDINILTDFYGEYWYKYFFILEHLTFSILNIAKNLQKRNDIIQKYSKEWYDKHIENIKIITRSEYNFQTHFKQVFEVKHKFENTLDKDIDNNNFLIESNIMQQGGFLNDNIQDEEDEKNQGDEDEYDEEDKINVNSDYIKPIDENYEGETIDTDDIYDMEELTNMYQENEVQIDKNSEKIKDLIESAIEKTYENRDEKMEHICLFPKGKNGAAYDDILKNVYIKNYVYNQYIFNSDTIKIIKQKICAGIQCNPKFNKKSPFIIPSRIYLWSEYEYEGKSSDNKNIYKRDKIMLGQKWIKRNEILSIDIEPNDNLYLYEKLHGNLMILKDNIKKYGSKIRREDDDNNILSEYTNYYLNNELFIIDIYNELGSNYSIGLEEQKNLYDVYIRIYFSGISPDELKHIIDYVGANEDLKKIEENKILSVYQNIVNDLLLEGEITRTIEQIKIEKLDYMSILKTNYITQAVIHININFKALYNIDKLNLYIIFDSYIVSESYPYIEYQKNGKSNIKIYDKSDKQVVLAKWFENSPYGINFKIKIDQKGGYENKYIAVSLFETGRLEYKTQWKESDHATIEDIIMTYKYIRELIEKINIESTKNILENPIDSQFKYAFINTIQHFELSNNYSINHNDLSDFARFFYPYISIVIDPRKRQSKNIEKNDLSKYGTYLRYKRISKYENESKIENRIIHFLRNYEYIPKILALEISKQFNIIEKEALSKIEEVVMKHPLLKKSRKILKKLENIPKFKPPGIGIDIQGRNKENYKIRIAGARSQEQLDQILEFLAILLYLYTDTYLIKNPARLKIKEKLKTLTNIAKRRNKVDEVIRVSNGSSAIKIITKLDKDRIGFKPEKGQTQWSRSCQNSGDQNRRPALNTDETIEDLLKLGYNLNSESGDYERKIKIKGKKDIILKAARLPGDTSLYYTCNPEVNKEYTYIGFLARSNNPSGLCMPCCFKKDPAISVNQEKKNYHLHCMGKITDKSKNVSGDKLYILQDTNKMLMGRLGYLSKYLDYFFNSLLNKNKVIKNNYLIESQNGIFMKYGSDQSEYPYLNAIAVCIGLTFEEIKEKIIDGIKKDTIFNFLNSGEIKTQFKTTENFINILNTNLELDHILTDDLISIPNIILPEGINVYIIEKKINEKLNTIDFVLLCKNIENIIYYQDPIRKNIILLKEDFNYYPIVDVYKNANEKNLNMVSLFHINKSDILEHLTKYMNLSCSNISFMNINTNISTAKNIYYTLINKAPIEFKPINQVIDLRNKCKYLISSTGFLIPIKPSGTLYELPFISIYDKYINPLDKSLQFLLNLSKYININPKGFIYSTQIDNKYIIEAIIIDIQILIPVKPINLDANELKKLLPNYILESVSLYDVIDNEIQLGPSNIFIDDRIIEMQKNKYYSEHYELFRYELANYLNFNIGTKNKIIKILDKHNINKVYEIKKILLMITSKELYNIYINTVQENEEADIILNDELESQVGGEATIESSSESEIDIKTSNNLKIKNNSLVSIIQKESLINDYQVENHRKLCVINNNMNECNLNPHCNWQEKKCIFSITEEKLIEFIARIVDELINNELKSKELLNLDQYFISDIVNYDIYTQRDNQKIIKSNNININKILIDIFGKTNIPTIGKRNIYKNVKIISDENLIFPIEKINNIYYQTIFNLNIIFRAYTNSLYWIQNNLTEIIYRNLGYYSILQTELSNIFKSYIYDWILNDNNKELLYNTFKDIINISYENLINDYRTKLFVHKEYFYLGLIDLYILNQYHHIPIVLLNQYDNIFCIIDEKIIYLNFKNKNNQDIDQKYIAHNNIKIKYIGINLSINSNPSNLVSIYEL